MRGATKRLSNGTFLMIIRETADLNEFFHTLLQEIYHILYIDKRKTVFVSNEIEDKAEKFANKHL